ncbi:MAG: hypothetical protein HYV14_16980 [Elusimicrobia bacterium]|nr:hypothetical protein [Elusimicrobiota bacterium]
MSRLLVETLDSWSWLRARGYDEVWYAGREWGAPVPRGARRVLFGQDTSAVFRIKRFAVFLAERLFPQVYPEALRRRAYREAELWFGWQDPEAFDLYLKKRLYEHLIDQVKGRYLVKDAAVLGDGGPDIGPLMHLFDRYASEPVTRETVDRFLAEPASPATPSLTPWPGVSRALRLGAIAWFALKRLGLPKAVPVDAKYALRWVGPLTWRDGRLFHHFLFYDRFEDTGGYRPENILLLIDPTATAEDLRRLDAGGYRWILRGKPTGLEPRLARAALTRLPRLTGFPEPVIQLFQKLLEHEHELSRFSCRLYRECAEYSADSILKAAALGRREVPVFNIAHGDDFVHTESTCYIKLDRFFIWSQRQLDIFRFVWGAVKKIEIIGPFKNDYFRLPLEPEHAALMKRTEGRFRVAVFDTTFSDDAYITRADVRRMYDDVLWALDQLPNRLIVIKSKLYNSGKIFEMEGFRDLGERIEGREDVFVMSSQFPAQEAFKTADLVIAFGPSTVGVEALCCGKDLLFYDTLRLAEHPFLRYPGVVYHDRDALLARLRELAAGGVYMEPAARKAMVEYEGLPRPGHARFFAEAIGARQ